MIIPRIREPDVTVEAGTLPTVIAIQPPQGDKVILTVRDDVQRPHIVLQPGGNYTGRCCICGGRIKCGLGLCGGLVYNEVMHNVCTNCVETYAPGLKLYLGLRPRAPEEDEADELSR